MDSFIVVSRNGHDLQGVLYPEGEYPTEDSAITAAKALRQTYPLDSPVVRDGWYTCIAVVAADGDRWSPSLYCV